MEVSVVRNRLRLTMEQARQRARLRRERNDEAQRHYAAFIEQVATPVTRMLASALTAEGRPFSVHTPGDSVRLASDRNRSDGIEFGLDVTGASPQVVGHVHVTRGSRVVEEERVLKAGTAPDALTDEDVLEFLLDALEPWLDR